jgi:replicative DNA helicase
MAAMLSREQAKAPLSLVVVDYLQLVEAQGKHRARNEAIAEVSASLKRMALDLDVPVIAVAQLNRAPEARSGKAPTMADLADSDALGRDCDWAILIHRDPPAPKGATNEPGTADLIVDANRDGYTGKVRVMLNPVSLQFEEQEVVEYGQQATA